MPKFRKKPVVIEAVQLLDNSHSIHQVECFIEGHEVDSHSCRMAEDRWDVYVAIVRKQGGRIIKTLEGDHLASFGDWVIKGVKGEFYPCKPDIFEKTYEPAD